MVNPAHHIAQNALHIVVNLFTLVLVAPVRMGLHGDAQQILEQGLSVLAPHQAAELFLDLFDIDLVVMQGVQGGGGGAGYPGGVGAGLGVGHFLRHHQRHQVGHGPHAFADLGAPLEPAGQTHQDVVELVSLDPGGGLHLRLAHHRAGLHGGVHLIARAVQKAGVDERQARAGRMNAGHQVHTGAPLLVHDAELDGVLRETQGSLNLGEQFIGEGHFGRAMHLGLDDVDRALPGVLDLGGGVGFEVMQGNGGGDEGVHDAFGDFQPLCRGGVRVAVLIQDGRVGHQVPNIAQK